jgi:hypothetical protein
MGKQSVNKIGIGASTIEFIDSKNMTEIGYESISDIKFEKNNYADTVKIVIGSDHINPFLYKRAIQHLANIGYYVKKTDESYEGYRPEDHLRGHLIMVKSNKIEETTA